MTRARRARVGVVLGWVVGFLAVRFVLLAGHDMLHAPALERENYRGRTLVTAGGLFLVMAVLIVEAGRSTLGAFDLGDAPGLNPARPLVLFAAFGFGLLGFMDDVLGSEDRGFRGHLRALSQGRLTTGMLKLIGGAGDRARARGRARVRHRQAAASPTRCSSRWPRTSATCSTGRPAARSSARSSRTSRSRSSPATGPVGIAVAPGDRRRPSACCPRTSASG